MGHGDPGQPRMFDLNRPQGFAKDEYLLMWRESQLAVVDIIKTNRNAQNVSDVVHEVMLAISLIAHDDLRRKQEMLFHLALKHIRENISDSTEQNEEVFRICAITMGNLTSYVDQFRGLAHTLKIGELYNFDKPYAKVKSAFGENNTGTPDVINI